MKLLYCPACADVLRLTRADRYCDCGASWGTEREVGGEGVPIGLTDSSLKRAIKNRNPRGRWTAIDAGVLPLEVSSLVTEKETV